MPVLALACPKGGVGKSTIAVLVGTISAKRGIEVTIIDCDPNRSVTRWGGKAPVPNNIKIVHDVTESNIISTIKREEENRLVIVDLEGIASKMMSRSLSRADLVLIPMRPTMLDAEIGSKAIELINEEIEHIERKIDYCVVFTNTGNIITKQQRALRASFDANNIDIIEPSLGNRTAYSALFATGGDLYTMAPEGNMLAAIENAEKFTDAVLDRLLK
jgi:chromosome partitioning protein